MSGYLEQLNPPQKEAVINFEGPNLIIAGAGSGKTRVLTYKIAYLLQRGFRAENIIALTFTNKAANEMKERVINLTGTQNARYLWLGTFHSIFARILRKEYKHSGYTSNFTIYDSDDSRSMIKAIIKDMKLDDKIYKASEIHNRISFAKNNFITASRYLNDSEIQRRDAYVRKPEIGNIYNIYTMRLKISDAMDFDDLLLNTYELFDNHPEVLQKYRKQFRYVLVDEYQDTNYVQYLIVKKLASEHHNISVVGDDSQSIYAFRGAKIENIFNFKKDFPDYRIYKLEQNYRSTKNIVNAANSLIAHNNKRIPKEIWSDNETGEKVTVRKALTDAEESYIITNAIKDYKEKYNFTYSDFAVLYRINAQSRVFEEAMRRSGIPYKVYGGMSFYQRREIKDTLAYFRLVVNHNDDEAFKRVINYPARGIGKTSLEKIEMPALANNTCLWNIINDHALLTELFTRSTFAKISGFINIIRKFTDSLYKMPAFELASLIIRESGIIAELESEKTLESVTRIQNIEELLNAVKDFCITQQFEDNEKEIYLDSFLHSISLQTESDNSTESSEHVSLMTAHAAKGLEFNCVFLAGAEHELFPMKYGGHQPQEYEIEEERRLFYVALTRAKKIANISYAEHRYKWGSLESCHPSKFISEIDNEFIEMLDEFPSPSEQISNYRMAEEPAVYNFNKKPASVVPIPPKTRKKLTNLNEIERKTRPEKHGNSYDYIEEGMSVIHELFGKGTVVEIVGNEPNARAIINFDASGPKQLLLRFARLKIINAN